MPHDPTEDIIVGEGIAVNLFDLLPPELAERAATLSETDLTGAYVGDAGAMAWQNGRCFTFFKPPNSKVNVLFELILAAPERLITIGPMPGAGKDGGCTMAIRHDTGEVVILNASSPNPDVGAQAQQVLWKTNIFVGALVGTPGPRGLQGVAGPVGPIGPKGATGPQGVPGPASGTVDQAVLNRIAALENKLTQAQQEINLLRGQYISVDSRLDSISLAAKG